MAEHYELDTDLLDKLIRNNPDELDAWWAGVAEQMTNEIKLSFNSGPAGMSYERGEVTHVASSPGYPPNIDTGALVNSMNWTQERKLRNRIQDGVAYGIHLEEGTSSIQPRPFVQPVFFAWNDEGKLAADALAAGIITP